LLLFAVIFFSLVALSDGGANNLRCSNRFLVLL